MSLNQLIDNGVTTPCLPWKKIKVYDMDACNSITSPEGNFDNVDTTTINGAPYPPGAAVLPALVANKLLRTNATATAVLWGDVPHGTARQLLQTNAGATGSEWTSNVDIPGTLDVTGNVVLDNDLAVTNDLNVLNGDVTVANGDLGITLGNLTVAAGDVDISTGDLRVVGDLSLGGNLSFNAVSGTVGQVVKKTGALTQAFSDIGAGDIKGGTLNQVFISNGTNGVFSSNVDIPGTLDVTGQTNFDSKIFAASGAEVSAGNLSVNTGDIAVLNGNLEVQTGALTVAGNINNSFGGTATFTNENITGNLQFASVSGISGNFLKKTGAATQAFADIGSTDIKGGTNNQFLQSNGTNAVFNTNITCPGSVVALGTMTTAGVMNMNGNLQFVTQSGATGNFIKKTTGTTQTWSNIAASDTKGGSNNQVMVSNGTNAVFSDSLSLPTSLAVGTTANITGITTLANNLIMSGAAAVFQMAGVGAVALLNETRVYGQLKFGAVAGVAGTVPVSDAGGIPTWRYAQYFARYFDSTPVDMNNGGGGALTLLAAASPDVANANITYLAGVFTLGEAGHYNIRFQTNATTVGAGAQTLINIKTNGNFAGSYTTTVVPGIQSVVLEKSYMLLAAATVEVVSQQLAAGVINTSAADANAVATTVITITKIGPYV